MCEYYFETKKHLGGSLDDKERARLIGLNMMMATAIQQSMREIMNEQRDELIKRARAKLVALGVDPKDINDGTIKSTTEKAV